MTLNQNEMKEKWVAEVVAEQEQLSQWREQFNPVLQMQVVVVVLLFFALLGCHACSPTIFSAMQTQYQALFERADYTPSFLRFVQRAVEVVSIEASATDAPEGYSLTAYQTEETVVFPVAGYVISSGYGWREDPFDGEGAFHGGIDFACDEGTAIVAVMDGVVEKNYLSMSYGNCILMRHADGSVSLYAHMQYAFARVGEIVSAGTQIGTVGQTGWATGPHLHFEMQVDNERQDPTALFFE